MRLQARQEKLEGIYTINDYVAKITVYTTNNRLYRNMLAMARNKV